MELGIDPYKELDIVDYGDVEVRSSNLAHNHARPPGAGRRDPVGGRGGRRPGRRPLALHPRAGRRCLRSHGTDGFSVIHFDTHADTGIELEESPHGVPFPAR